MLQWQMILTTVLQLTSFAWQQQSRVMFTVVRPISHTKLMERERDFSEMNLKYVKLLAMIASTYAVVELSRN